MHKHAGAPLCEWAWEHVGGQRLCGLACAVPRHHQMVPCLHVTFWGPKPAPCGRTWGGQWGAHCPLWGDDITWCWPMDAWPLQPGRAPHHSQGRVTAMVTPASANAVYRDDQGGGSAPWWHWRRGLCCRGCPRGKEANRAWGSCGVCTWFGWVGSSPLPYCVHPCQWLSHTWHFWMSAAPSLQRLQTRPEQEMLDSHPHAWSGGCSLAPTLISMRLRPEQTHHT